MTLAEPMAGTPEPAPADQRTAIFAVLDAEETAGEWLLDEFLCYDEVGRFCGAAPEEDAAGTPAA